MTDGDTIDVTLADGGTETVRILGLNAPEPDECHGTASTTVLADLLEGGSVSLVEGDEDRDQFGRLLREVWVEDTNVAVEMIAVGAAIAYHDSRSPQEFLAIQESARTGGRGLWAADACGPASGASLEVTDIGYDAPGDDSQNLNEEWIRITNRGTESVDLTGWQVRDESASNRFTFGTVILGAGESVVLVSGCGDYDGSVIYWCAEGAAIWNNDGDAVFILDPARNIVAYRGYVEGDPSATLPTPVPPTTVAAATTIAGGEAHVTISAINFDAPGNDNENKNGEWVRLRNQGSVPADLSGWRLEDEGPNHTYWFPNGYTLAGGAELTIYTGCGTDTAAELYWCKGGSAVWNNGGDTAFLYDATGTLIDSRSG